MRVLHSWMLLLIIGLGLNAGPLVAADSIQRSPQLPDTLPWNLEQLSAPPSFSWVQDAGPVRSLQYAGEPYQGKPTRVFAYYASPVTLGQQTEIEPNALPGVVLIHGGGGTAFAEWAEMWARRGYAAIAMDLAGHRPLEGKNPHARENRERLPDGGPQQGDEEKFGNIGAAVTEQWPYHAVANVLRAHSLLRSFPEVGDQTAVTGISWGGYLTNIVAALDDRFDAAVPVYGCGFLHENSAWLRQLGSMTPDLRERWVQLWEPSRYLPAVRMPILFVNGTNDFAYPLDSYMKSFDAVPGERFLRVTVNMPHSHPAGWEPAEIAVFIDHHLLDKPGLPRISSMELQDANVTATSAGPAPITAAALHFTTDTGPINMRTWETRTAALQGEQISVEIPPKNATAYFLTVTDQRNLTVSSRVYFGTPSAKDSQP